MKSYHLRGRLSLLIPALAILAFGLNACATPRVIPVALNCSSRVPPQLRDDVPGAALPADQTVGEWIAYADASDAARAQANDEKATVLWIVDNCEGEEAKAVKSIERPWWRFWE